MDGCVAYQGSLVVYDLHWLQLYLPRLRQNNKQVQHLCKHAN